MVERGVRLGTRTSGLVVERGGGAGSRDVPGGSRSRLTQTWMQHLSKVNEIWYPTTPISDCNPKMPLCCSLSSMVGKQRGEEGGKKIRDPAFYVCGLRSHVLALLWFPWLCYVVVLLFAGSLFFFFLNTSKLID